MSTTTHLICKDCKIELWVGQSCRLYSTPVHMTRLEEFLLNHKNHHLEFIDHHDIDNMIDTGEWDKYEKLYR